MAGVTAVDNSEKTSRVYAKRHGTRCVFYILRYPLFYHCQLCRGSLEKIVFTLLSLRSDRQTWQGRPVARFSGAGCT